MEIIRNDYYEKGCNRFAIKKICGKTVDPHLSFICPNLPMIWFKVRIYWSHFSFVQKTTCYKQTKHIKLLITIELFFMPVKTFSKLSLVRCNVKCEISWVSWGHFHAVTARHNMGVFSLSAESFKNCLTKNMQKENFSFSSIWFRKSFCFHARVLSIASTGDNVKHHRHSWKGNSRLWWCKRGSAYVAGSPLESHAWW